ncbi:unnamed protein product [Bursaphelenchus xylophilus]|uniref:(pine wood nematode) hypothetical protein n=1 Tax=Bursaphelenchus xylophilus TaxID=6326 RepID=A0A811K8L3_BURXY|nr:unnamed protein product [Bursaphelenchus xylophilus]CAG9089209.1 unnamed protein product [Bursaphelenchus xylophilus]
MQEALKLGIGDVVIPRLVFDAVKNGEWTKLIGQVGEPKQLFPADGYDEIIAPACLYALIHNRSPGPRSTKTKNVRRMFLDEGGPVVPTANSTLESFYGLNSDDAYGDANRKPRDV